MSPCGSLAHLLLLVIFTKLFVTKLKWFHPKLALNKFNESSLNCFKYELLKRSAFRENECNINWL